MDPEGKKPGEDTTTKAPTSADDQAKKNEEAQKTVVATASLDMRARSYQRKAEVFRIKTQDADDLINEGEQLIEELRSALEDTKRSLEEKERTLEEKDATQKILLEENETLQKENLELREHQIAGLRQELEVNKTSREVIEKKLEAAEKAKEGRFGKGAVTGSLVVLLFLLGAWVLFSKSGPQSMVSTGGSPATQAQNGATKPSLLTNSAVVKQYQEYTESHAPVRVYDPLLVGRQQVVSICEPEKNGLGFVLRLAIFEEGKIVEVSPPIDTYGDGRQQRGFSPCFIPMV